MLAGHQEAGYLKLIILDFHRFLTRDLPGYTELESVMTQNTDRRITDDTDGSGDRTRRGDSSSNDQAINI